MGGEHRGSGKSKLTEGAPGGSLRSREAADELASQPTGLGGREDWQDLDGV